MAKHEYGEAVIKWITITVLVAVSIFFVILYKNIFIDPSSGNPGLPQVSGEPEPSSSESPSPSVTEQPEGPVIVYSDYPRTPEAYGAGWYQGIGGAGSEKLKEVMTIGDYYYLILETDSNSWDFKATITSIAIAKVSLEGVMVGAVTLSGGRAENYLSSKAIGNGIMIAAQGDSGITYYSLSLDLTYSKAVTGDDYDRIKMYYTRDYVLIAGEKDNKITAFALDFTLNRKWSRTLEYTDNARVIEIFPSAQGFSLAVSIDSESPCSYFTAISSIGAFLGNTSLGSGELIKAIPCSSGWTLMVKNDNSLRLKLLNFSLETQFDTALGEGTGGDFYCLNNGYVVFLYGESGTVSKHLCRYGDIITVNDYDFTEVTSINSFASGNGEVFFYADVVTGGGGKDTRIYNYTSNNIVNYTSTIGGYFQESGIKIVASDGFLTVFLTSFSVNGCFIDNLGGADVYVFRVAV